MLVINYNSYCIIIIAQRQQLQQESSKKEEEVQQEKDLFQSRLSKIEALEQQISQYVYY